MATTEPEIESTDREERDLGGQMSFLDHLEELRQRILRAIVAVAIGFVLCWSFATPLFEIVAAPIRASGAVGTTGLVIISPTEGFNLMLKVAVVAAIFLTSPFLMAQVWLFIAPGLYKNERRYAAPFVISSSLLFILGGAFAYFIAFPFAVNFLVQMAVDAGLGITISASEYFDLFLTIMIAMGIVFEIPALIFVLARMGLVTAGFLARNIQYAVLITFIVAAIITPTSDVPNMMIVAVPMILLYTVGIGVAWVFGRKRQTN